MIMTTKIPLHLVIAEHGAARVFWAALVALFTVRHHQEEQLELLSDHIRKDIGLPPRIAPPPKPVIPIRW